MASRQTGEGPSSLSPRTEVPPALARPLAAALTGASASRARQLRWVVGELTTYAPSLSPGQRPVEASDWFDGAFITAFLTAADSGQLRRRGTTGRPTPDATRRVRRSCLRLLAYAAGLPDPVSDQILPPSLKSRADPVPARLALAHLAGEASRSTASAGEVRAAAMAALVREAGLRSGELAALEPASIDLDAATLTYQPRPPAARELPPVRTTPLSAPTVKVVAHWLQVRAELTRDNPWTRTLWVSLAPNHDGTGRRRPSGLPLRPNGVRRAHTRAVSSVNVELAGTPGYFPLPATVGRLRDTSATPTSPGRGSDARPASMRPAGAPAP